MRNLSSPTTYSIAEVSLNRPQGVQLGPFEVAYIFYNSEIFHSANKSTAEFLLIMPQGLQLTALEWDHIRYKRKLSNAAIFVINEASQMPPYSL